MDTDLACNSFQNKLTNVFETYAPITTIPSRQVIGDRWLTTGLLKSSNKLDMLCRNEHTIRLIWGGGEGYRVLHDGTKKKKPIWTICADTSR